MNVLTHLDAAGAASMVDVSAKAATTREAVAEGRIVMKAETLALALQGQAKKGDVVAVARALSLAVDSSIAPVSWRPRRPSS